MRLTTKGRYAVTAMIDLAINQGNGPVTLRSISDNQGISLSYLEQLFSKMRKSNLIVGTRGPGGGYVMAKEVDQISIADIIVAVDEPLDITECAGLQNCHDGQRCLSHGLWSALSDQLYDFLASIQLGQLMRQSGIHYEFSDELTDKRVDEQSGEQLARRQADQQYVDLPSLGSSTHETT